MNKNYKFTNYNINYIYISIIKLETSISQSVITKKVKFFRK